MNRLYSAHKTVLCALLVAAGLMTIGTLPAAGQDTDTSQPLERIDVEAPERRPAARAATTPRSGAGYDEPAAMDWPSSEDSEDPSQVFSGRGMPESTRSLVTQKSQVSLGAESLPAQVQVVTSQDLQRLQTWQEPSNLLRRVAGVRVYSFNEGTVGVAMAMRGFYSAREIGIYIDGVPQNIPSSVAGTGRALIHWLNAEDVERIEVIKGPFSALYGDFSMAGVVNIVTKKSEPSPSVRSYGGSFGAFRAFGVLSSNAVFPTPYLTQEYYTTDGWRENSAQEEWSTFNKVSVPTLGGILSMRYNYYQSEYGTPGYLFINEVKSGKFNRRQAVDPLGAGELRHYEVVMNYAPAYGERGLYGTLFIDNFDERRKILYYTASSAQTGRAQERTVWGGSAYYNLVFGDIASLTVGGETRQDSGNMKQFKAWNGEWTSTTYDYGLRLSNWAVFLQGQIKPAKYLKLVGGVRWDWFTQRIENLINPQNSGEGTPYIRSPKIGVVITPTENFNIFGNIGCGFRSPSNLEVSPYQATQAANFELEPAMVQTFDVGCNFNLLGRLYFAADYYHTYTEREIKTIDNQPVNIGNTLREGYELETTIYPSDSKDFSVFASYAWVDATVPDPTNPGQFVLTGVPEHIVKGGVSIQRDFGWAGKVLADLDYEYVSGTPGYSSSSSKTPLYAPDYDVYNLKLTYEGNGWSAFASAQCHPREYSGPYTWVSKGDHVFNPQPKWQVVSGLKYVCAW